MPVRGLRSGRRPPVLVASDQPLAELGDSQTRSLAVQRAPIDAEPLNQFAAGRLGQLGVAVHGEDRWTERSLTSSFATTTRTSHTPPAAPEPTLNPDAPAAAHPYTDRPSLQS